MKAALRGYEDGSLRYLQPDWHQCTVYESPSNSLFEVIVRDIPAEITDVSPLKYKKKLSKIQRLVALIFLDFSRKNGMTV